MLLKDRIKVAKRALARYGLFTFTWLFNKLPYGFVKALTHALIPVGYGLTVKQRRIALESLQIAFGNEKTPKQLKRIYYQCFANVGRSMTELMYFMNHPSMIKEKTVFEGMENLQEAFARKKGVIAVSAHFGNFVLMLLSLAQNGVATSAIIRSTRDKKIEEYFQNLRSSLGLKTVYSLPRKACVDQSLKALRDNELLFIPLDQNFGSGGGVFVDFFGQKAATATGPVVFAMRTGAPILPVFTVRKRDDVHKIIIEPPLTIEEGKDDKETIFINTERITRIIEQYIRAYPQEWGWMHRRWKSRPASRKA